MVSLFPMAEERGKVSKLEQDEGHSSAGRLRNSSIYQRSNSCLSGERDVVLVSLRWELGARGASGSTRIKDSFDVFELVRDVNTEGALQYISPLQLARLALTLP